MNYALVLLLLVVAFFVGVIAEYKRSKCAHISHPIDRLWGRYDTVEITLEQTHSKHHRWCVVLPQADVAVVGAPDQEDVGELIEYALDEAARRREQMQDRVK